MRPSHLARSFEPAMHLGTWHKLQCMQAISHTILVLLCFHNIGGAALADNSPGITELVRVMLEPFAIKYRKNGCYGPLTHLLIL